MEGVAVLHHMGMRTYDDVRPVLCQPSGCLLLGCGMPQHVFLSPMRKGNDKVCIPVCLCQHFPDAFPVFFNRCPEPFPAGDIGPVGEIYHGDSDAPGPDIEGTAAGGTVFSVAAACHSGAEGGFKFPVFPDCPCHSVLSLVADVIVGGEEDIRPACGEVLCIRIRGGE